MARKVCNSAILLWHCFSLSASLLGAPHTLSSARSHTWQEADLENHCWRGSGVPTRGSTYVLPAASCSTLTCGDIRYCRTCTSRTLLRQVLSVCALEQLAAVVAALTQETEHPGTSCTTGLHRWQERSGTLWPSKWSLQYGIGLCAATHYDAAMAGSCNVMPSCVSCCSSSST